MKNLTEEDIPLNMYIIISIFGYESFRIHVADHKHLTCPFTKEISIS